MEKRSSLKLNFIMNAILSVSLVVYPLITFRYVSRILMPAGTGRVNFAASVVEYFNIFVQLGVPVYGIRACARVRDNREELSRTAHELLLINLIMCAVCTLALAGAVLLIPRLREDRMLFAVMGSAMALNALGMEWLYKALERYTYITVRSLAFKLIALIAMFFLIRDEGDYIWYGALIVLANSAAYLLNLLGARRLIDLRPAGRCNLKRHLPAIMTFFAMACATTVYTNLDTVMLGFMTTNADVGYYNAAVRIKAAMVGVVTSLGAVLMPRSAYCVENGRMDEFARISEKGLRFVLIAASFVSLYFVMFARQSIRVVSGDAYAPSVGPMGIIMPTALFIGLTNLLGLQMLVPLGRERVVLISEIVGAAVDLILNALLIPEYRAAGAAFGTLMAELAVLAVQAVALRDTLVPMLRRMRWDTLAPALALAAAASYWVNRTPLSQFAALAVSAICFFGIGGAALILRKDPLATEVVGDLRRRLHRR